MNILVLGATGGTGRQIVLAAAAKDYGVTALVRSKDPARLGSATLVQGDARDEAALARALDGCDAVISALGTALSPFREVTLLSAATRALVATMNRTGVRRLVCITGMGAGDSRGHGGFFYDRVFQPLLLRTIYADKDRQEEIVRASGLDWIIVRPTVLNDKAARGALRATTDLAGVRGGTISRADVAAFTLDQVEGNAWLHKAPLITW